MEFKTLYNRDFDEKTQEWNLFQELFSLSNFNLIGFYTVSEAEVCRPDLICYKIFNNIDLIDMLLKVNDIISPFSINEGQQLLFGDVSTMEILIDNTEIKSKLLENYINPLKKSRVDQNRVNYQKPQKDAIVGRTIPKANFTQIKFDENKQLLLLAPEYSNKKPKQENPITCPI